MFEFIHSLWPSLLYTLGCEKKLKQSLFKFIYNLIGKYLQTKKMFEFEKDAGDLSDYTLVLPAVSVGNVGEFSAFLVFFFLLCFGSESRTTQIKNFTGDKNFS